MSLGSNSNLTIQKPRSLSQLWYSSGPQNAYGNEKPLKNPDHLSSLMIHSSVCRIVAALPLPPHLQQHPAVRLQRLPDALQNRLMISDPVKTGVGEDGLEASRSFGLTGCSGREWWQRLDMNQ